jgi:hypothetical protein
MDSMGPPLLIPVHKLNEKGEFQDDTIPCPTAAHWLYRGEDLKDLTCAEYYAIIGHRPYTKDELRKQQLENEMNKNDENQDENDNPIKKKRGRKASIRYPFDPTHPLHSTHYQYIKSVQSTPVFNIYMPKFPGKPPVPPKNFSPASDKKQSKKTLHYLEQVTSWEKRQMIGLLQFLPCSNHTQNIIARTNLSQTKMTSHGSPSWITTIF